MRYSKIRTALLAVSLLFGFATINLAQTKKGEGTVGSD